MENEMSIEEYEILKSKISKLSYQDLVIMRNELSNNGKDNTREYALIDSEIKKRFIGKDENCYSSELYEQTKNNLQGYSVEDIKKYREEMIASGKMDERLLQIINEVLLDKASENIVNKSK